MSVVGMIVKLIFHLIYYHFFICKKCVDIR
nr:MAG TPA: hypothetical protein [Bacteriophage sp.]